MCNRKFKCNGEGHLAKHHRAELELAGIKIAPRDSNRGNSRSLGRRHNPRSGPATRGYRRSIRALVDNELRYVIAIDQETATMSWSRGFNMGYDTIPVINTMHARGTADVIDDVQCSTLASRTPCSTKGHEATATANEPSWQQVVSWTQSRAEHR